MWTDKSLLLCDKENFFGSAGTVSIGDVIDWRGREDLRGAGKPLALIVSVNTAMAGGTSANFVLQTADNLSSGNLGSTNRNVITMSGVATTAQLPQGAKFLTYLPFASWIAYRRYMQIRVVRVGTSSGRGNHSGSRGRSAALAGSVRRAEPAHVRG